MFHGTFHLDITYLYYIYSRAIVQEGGKNLGEQFPGKNSTGGNCPWGSSPGKKYSRLFLGSKSPVGHFPGDISWWENVCMAVFQEGL